MPTAPNPRVLVSGQPTVRDDRAVRDRGLPVHVGGGPVPCVTAQWVVAATRVSSNGQPRRADGQPGDLRAERHAARAGRGADARDRELRRRRTFTFRTGSTAAGTPDRRRRSDVHPRPDRAGAVHRAGRARDAARLRQRPAAARVRAEQPRARGDHADAGAGRAAAVARRPDRARGACEVEAADATLARHRALHRPPHQANGPSARSTAAGVA